MSDKKRTTKRKAKAEGEAATPKTPKAGKTKAPKAEGKMSALDAAATMNAYALVDRETWANAKNQGSLQILIEDDPALIKVYDSILASPDKEPLNRHVYARIWHDWLTNKHGNVAISSYKINGEQIFFACQNSALALCQAALR